MLKKIKETPMPVAIAIMALCLIVGITAGNKNALNRAIADNKVELTSIAKLADERATEAGNLLVVCRRAIKDDPSITALEEAIGAQKAAKRAGQIAQADQRLTFAAQEASEKVKADEGVSESDKKAATRAMDELTSKEKILTREAAAYNGGVAEVARVYNTLPTRWMFGGAPEAYR